MPLIITPDEATLEESIDRDADHDLIHALRVVVADIVERGTSETDTEVALLSQKIRFLEQHVRPEFVAQIERTLDKFREQQGIDQSELKSLQREINKAYTSNNPVRLAEVLQDQKRQQGEIQNLEDCRRRVENRMAEMSNDLFNQRSTISSMSAQLIFLEVIAGAASIVSLILFLLHK